MKKNTNCMQTIYACFIGYIVQAIVNNFVPLLFVTFQNNYHISLERIKPTGGTASTSPSCPGGAGACGCG